MILLSHPTGNEFVRNALAAFDGAEMLGEFWTTLSWSGQHRWLLPEFLQQLLTRRSYPTSIRRRTRTVPARELGRLLAGAFNIDDVNIDLDRKVAARLRSPRPVSPRGPDKIDNFKLVYAYEDAAMESFRTAAERGIHRVYDLPIGHWRMAQRIFAEEAKRQPEWASTLTGTQDSAEKLARKDEELRLAERIIVASTFTKKTLAEAIGSPHLRPLPTGEEIKGASVRTSTSDGSLSPAGRDARAKRGSEGDTEQGSDHATRTPFASKIDIIPYGAPSAISPEIKRPGTRLKVLFAGSLGQRKGISYALEAVEKFGNSVELTLIGRKAASNCAPLNAATRKHRWIPTLSHDEMLRQMGEHDLLIFPSLFEGFGLVVLEAMSQGTPVITSEHTCGPDIIDDGIDGFIVPIRSAEAIAEKIDILNTDRTRLMSMKAAARGKAAAHPWKIYRQRLVEMAREVIAE
jgi:starch synthase